MNATEAMRVLAETYPNANSIQEMGDNPNMLGWYLFSVDGRRCYVTQEGEILTREQEPPVQEKARSQKILQLITGWMKSALRQRRN